MKKIKFTTLLLAITAMVSCQKESSDPNYDNDPSVVKITADVGSSFTRSNPIDGVSTTFKTGDVICVSAETQTGINYTLSEVGWAPAETDKFLKWEENAMIFKAYYPVGVNGASMTTFNLPADQTTLDKIEKADYMTYTSPAPVAKAESVNLELARKTSRVVINTKLVNHYATGYTVEEIEILGNTSGYENGAIKSGNITISTYKHSADKFYALLIPTGEAGEQTNFLVTVKKTSDGSTQTHTAQAKRILSAGKSYSYTVSIGKVEMELSEVTVSDWATGDVIDNGDIKVIIKKGSGIIDLPAEDLLTEDMVRFAVNDVDKTIILKGKVSEKDLVTIKTAGNKIGTVHHIDFTDTESIYFFTSGIFDRYSGNIPLYNLQSIKLSKTTYSIGMNSFYYCENLVSVDAPGIGRLYNYAFAYCTKLQTVNAPKLTVVDNYAFHVCDGLKYLYLTTPSNIDYKCFNIMNECTLYLHENKKLKGSGTPTVGEDGVTWGGKTWKEIKYVNDAGEVIE